METSVPVRQSSRHAPATRGLLESDDEDEGSGDNREERRVKQEAVLTIRVVPPEPIAHAPSGPVSAVVSSPAQHAAEVQKASLLNSGSAAPVEGRTKHEICCACCCCKTTHDQCQSRRMCLCLTVSIALLVVCLILLVVLASKMVSVGSMDGNDVEYVRVKHVSTFHNVTNSAYQDMSLEQFLNSKGVWGVIMRTP